MIVEIQEQLKPVATLPTPLTLETFGAKTPLDARTADDGQIIRNLAQRALGLECADIANLSALPTDMRMVYDAVYEIATTGKRDKLFYIASHGDDGAAALAGKVVQEQFRINKRENRRKAKLKQNSLTRELFGADAIMVAPVDPMTGEYPPCPGQTCDSHAWVNTNKQGIITKAFNKSARLWRDRKHGDVVIPACPHCLHSRVIRLCHGIEYELSILKRWNQLANLSYSFVPAEHIKPLNEKLKRLDVGYPVHYSYYAVLGGRFYIHNAGDDFVELETKKHGALVEYTRPLPTDRQTLYDLIIQWATLAPNEERKTWGSSAGWGGIFKGTRYTSDDDQLTSSDDEQLTSSDDDQLTSSDDEQLTSSDDDDGYRVWFADRAQLSTAYFQVTGQKMTQHNLMGTHVAALIGLADERGIQWAVSGNADEFALLMSSSKNKTKDLYRGHKSGKCKGDTNSLLAIDGRQATFWNENELPKVNTSATGVYNVD